MASRQRINGLPSGHVDGANHEILFDLSTPQGLKIPFTAKFGAASQIVSGLARKVASRVLTEPAQEAGLARLLSIGKATHDKRGKRNALAHSGFERTMRIEGGTDRRHIILGQEVMRPASHAHAAIRGQDLEVVIPQILEEFRKHRDDVQRIWSWLRIGIPEDAGAPSPDTLQQPPKGLKPNRRERGQRAKAKEQRRPPGSSQE